MPGARLITHRDDVQNILTDPAQFLVIYQYGMSPPFTFDPPLSTLHLLSPSKWNLGQIYRFPSALIVAVKGRDCG